MKQLIVLVLSSIALLTGCDLLEEQTEDVKLTVDSSSYALGEAVVLKLENNTELTISHNLCYATVERRTAGGDWNEVRHQFGDVCEDEMNLLEPGEATTYTSR